MSKKDKSILGKDFKSLLEEKESIEDWESLEEQQDIVESKPILEKDSEIGTESEPVDEDVDEAPQQAEAPESVITLDEAAAEPSGEAPVVDADEDAGEDIIIDNIVVDDVEVLQSFIQESRDHLENMEEKILRLEKAKDPDVVNEIFRSMHTMKGTSSFLGLVKIKELSHSLESLLDKLRADKIGVSAELVDVLLAGTDLLGRMLGHLSMMASEHKGGKLELPDSGIDISSILTRIQEVSNEPEVSNESEVSGTEKKGVSDNELITDEMVEKFISESKDLLDSTEKDFLELEKRPNDKGLLDDAFRYIHTIKGNAGFLGYGNFEEMCMELESVLDSIRKGQRKADPKVVTILLNTVDSMTKMLGSLQDTGTEQETMEEESEYKPLGEILVEMGEVTQDAVEDALNKQERKIGEILVSEGTVSEQVLEKALDSQVKLERKDIRVDMTKLDKLFDLMGELITAEAMVIHNPEMEGMELESFARAGNYLTKITREMQEITMTVRMIPLEGLFNKMRRLVRDLSRKFAKKINLVVSGQETEMDRNVIEQISDPLVHILRNSIDHGIEAGSTRGKKGKDETGTVSLGARYEGNEIWITIKDDGAGLDREKILAKAEERGLIKADRANIQDEEVWQLLFEPGFSTAEKVSEVSGRGVGMDVVRRNIEKLRGKIDIKSTSSEGTEIILRIPLTLAIIDGITVKVGKILYALPLGDILEFHKGSEEQITKSDNRHEVLKLREDIIPVIKLYEFFNGETDKTGIADGIVIIAQSNGRKAGLLVDDIVGYQQIVVKALPDYLGGMRAISGCSILGDGEVSLIIDTGSLMKEELE